MATASAELSAPHRRALRHAHALLLAAVGVVASGALGCGQTEAAEAEPAPAAAATEMPAMSEEAARASVERTVREAFGRMAARDCPGLAELIGGAVAERLESRGGCERMAQTDPGALSLTLLRVDTPRRDARNPRAYMVPLVMESDTAQEQPVLARVEWLGGRFRLVAL